MKSSLYSVFLAFISVRHSQSQKNDNVEVEGCRTEDINMEYFCPIVRYCEWGSQSKDNQKLLKKEIGYKESEWNYEEINEIETIFFMGLDDKVREGLMEFGFTEDKHDCCLGHYEDYDWIDFDPDDGFGETLAALELLGYNEELWDSGAELVYDDMWWDELPLDIQWAYYDWFCYTRELWNEVTIPDWPIDADIPGSEFLNETETTETVPVVENNETVPLENDMTPMEDMSNTTNATPSDIDTTPVVETSGSDTTPVDNDSTTVEDTNDNTSITPVNNDADTMSTGKDIESVTETSENSENSIIEEDVVANEETSDNTETIPEESETVTNAMETSEITAPEEIVANEETSDNTETTPEESETVTNVMETSENIAPEEATATANNNADNNDAPISEMEEPSNNDESETVTNVMETSEITAPEEATTTANNNADNNDAQISEMEEPSNNDAVSPNQGPTNTDLHNDCIENCGTSCSNASNTIERFKCQQQCLAGCIMK